MAARKALGLGSVIAALCVSQIANASATSQSGMVKARYWDNVSGINVNQLIVLNTYPDNPDQVKELTELRSLLNRRDNYGSLVRGYIIPPSDGRYTFFVAGDDQTQFWLSTSNNPAAAELTAAVTGWTRPDEYPKYGSQTSSVMELAAGQRYYFEIRHKEASGDDHFNVAWEGPGIPRQIVGGGAIASLGEPGSTAPLAQEAIRNAYAQGYRAGLLDGSEGLRFSSQYPMLDKDQDGLYDNWEIVHGLDPIDPSDASSDRDNDMLTALDEFLLGTNPNNPDTDGDGTPDGVEFAYGRDPLDASAVTEPQSAPEPTPNEVSLSWTAPLTRADGSSLSLAEIDHSEIRYGQDRGNQDQSITAPGDATSVEIGDLATGNWYFSIRVVDTSGLQSAFSAPAEYIME